MLGGLHGKESSHETLSLDRLYIQTENLQSGPGIKKAIYATNDMPPHHISIDLTIHSCTHKYNSIKHKIIKHLSDLRSSNASPLLVPPNLHPAIGAAAHIGQELVSLHRILIKVSQI